MSKRLNLLLLLFFYCPVAEHSGFLRNKFRYQIVTGPAGPFSTNAEFTTVLLVLATHD